MDSDACDLSKLSARELLLRYRKHLPSGAYYFIGKGEDARPEDITEIYGPSGQPKESGQEVVFGFFEKGCPSPDLHIKDAAYWLHRYPFSHHITSTSSEFQEKLASHIRARLLNVPGNAETKTVADQ